MNRKQRAERAISRLQSLGIEIAADYTKILSAIAAGDEFYINNNGIVSENVLAYVERLIEGVEK